MPRGLGRSARMGSDMTSVANGIVFRQEAVRRKHATDYSKIEKNMDGCEDAATFFLLADAACSPHPVSDIERIHVDVFEKQKKVRPARPPGLMDTIEIMRDPTLMRQLRAGIKEGETIPWEKIKVKA